MAEPRMVVPQKPRPAWYARLWSRLPRAFFMLTLLYRALDRAASPIDPLAAETFLAEEVSIRRWRRLNA